MIPASSPSPVWVQPLENHRLRLRFEDGLERIFDVSPYLEDDYFSSLRSPAVFNTVRINGLTVEWMGGIDICPDELYLNSHPVENAFSGL